MPSGCGEAEFVEKRSRFIGQVWQVESEAQARELIAKTKSKHYDARHNCWCYVIHDIMRYADDGEPQGTAGQPMLEVFRRGGIENVLCVVTRYFGGILLGAGGLTRAYAHTAKLALDAAGISEMRLWISMEIVCSYSLFERVKKEIDMSGGSIDTVDYATDVVISALFPVKTAPLFEKRLLDMTSGNVIGKITGEKYIAVPVNGT